MSRGRGIAIELLLLLSNSYSVSDEDSSRIQSNRQLFLPTEESYLKERRARKKICRHGTDLVDESFVLNPDSSFTSWPRRYTSGV
ncbi:unnamed protein product [Protopolystoma xenopodis]|uniref:Secreted protein n=1 Tax=Protopolystoma xenopodis TaxID=117903 RepID=A0A3S5FGK1_9PLAT|nr:unnamed protein product [Protopolystoma xenopodis]